MPTRITKGEAAVIMDIVECMYYYVSASSCMLMITVVHTILQDVDSDINSIAEGISEPQPRLWL